jgi:endogenous inhibitor of DNA gyrase (YacG/DUF329 family)
MGLTVKCPICRAPIPWEGNPYRPFCSERCQLIDLGAWAKGKYRIPGKKEKEEREREDDGDGDDEEHS